MNTTDDNTTLQEPPAAQAGAVRVRVFGRAGCQQCRMTRMVLDRAGIPYQDIDVDRLGDDAADRLRDLGFQQLPVVQAPGMDPWSGFQPAKLDELKDRLV